MIRPETIDAEVLTGINVADSGPVWAANAIYAQGDRVTLPPVSLDLDFENGSYLSNGASFALTALPGYSYSRTGAVAYQNAGGGASVVDNFAANVAPVVAARGYKAVGALTNLIPNSTAATPSTRTGGFSSGATLTTGYGTAPDGTTTSVRVQVAAEGYIYWGAESLSANRIYTGSIWVRAATPQSIAVRRSNDFGSLGRQIIDVTTTWQRIPVSLSTAGTGSVACEFGFDTRDAVVGGSFGAIDVEVWQPQMFPGTYNDGGPIIATTGSAAGIGAPTLSIAAESGDYEAVYTFDDNTEQTIATTVASGAFVPPTYPATLNRPTVKRIRLFYPGGSDDTGRVYESLTAGNVANVTLTIASPCVVSWTAHGFADGTPIYFATTGALPTGLTEQAIYYVKSPTANSFNLSTTAGGSTINTSGSQSGVHRATAAPNLNKNPPNYPDFWLDVGASNRWAMFDDVVGTVTTDPVEIDFTLQLAGRVDSLALFNLTNAVSVQIIVTVTPEGEVYNETFDLTAADGIVDWYSWFTEEILRQTNFLATDLPAYSDPTVRVIVTGTGTADLSVGNFAVGRQFNFGRTLHDGAQVGILDYSRKEADDFGNYSIVQRAFSKRGSFKTRIARGQVDAIQNVLSQYRATPAVYSASSLYGATLIFGFFREFNVEIDYPQESLVSIDIEGLT